MKKSDFYYSLPEHLIAQAPLSERSASRLLCLERTSGQLTDRYFTDFIDLIRPNDILIFNDTKVIPARLFGKKTTGGKVEILIERIFDDQQALAHVKASKSPKAGTLIELDKNYCCTVLSREDDLFRLEFAGSSGIHQVLADIGHIPLPPYIERADNSTDVARYQTVFAKTLGAVAAPTAGLHFDEAMLERINALGASMTYVTLHVGSGTFQPVRVENLADHLMHKEFFSVPTATVEAIECAKQCGGRVIAIGTTAVRALESSARNGKLMGGFGDTDLFITPGYRFNCVDAMLTNFHLPESTLLMLVSAFAGYKPVMAAYQHAIAKSYRFFSYGDAMFIATA